VLEGPAAYIVSRENRDDEASMSLRNLCTYVLIYMALLLGRMQFSAVTDVRTSNLTGTNTHNNLLAFFFLCWCVQELEGT
jgi:hypothetical protein